MTEENTTPEPIDEQPVDDAQEPQEAPETPEPEDTEQERATGNSEAAKWRVRFREAEATVATLTARVEALQRAEIARMATGPGKLHDGDDLAAGADLAALLDDGGEIDPEKVTSALDELLERKPHLRKPVFTGDVGQGQRGDSGGSVSWHDVIAG